VNYADTSEHQAVSNTGDPWPPQRVPDTNPPSAPKPEPRTSPENEPEQNDRAARLDELLGRADQAAQRIAAQQAERQASSEYATRMELEAQTQAEAGQQAQARDEVELELLRRSSSALPDESVDQVAHQRYRLRLTAARIGHDPNRQVRHFEREEQAVKVRLKDTIQDPVRGELVTGQARPDQPGRQGRVGARRQDRDCVWPLPGMRWPDRYRILAEHGRQQGIPLPAAAIANSPVSGDDLLRVRECAR
jgi:hypothetical protein